MPLSEALKEEANPKALLPAQFCATFGPEKFVEEALIFEVAGRRQANPVSRLAREPAVEMRVPDGGDASGDSEGARDERGGKEGLDGAPVADGEEREDVKVQLGREGGD